MSSIWRRHRRRGRRNHVAGRFGHTNEPIRLRDRIPHKRGTAGRDERGGHAERNARDPYSENQYPIPRPEDVVAEMVRVVKPGGWVLVDEADGAVSLCYPPHPAWDRLSEIFRAAYRSDGADLSIGRKVSHLLRHAGLVEIGTEARVDVNPAGHSRRTLLPDLVASMQAKIIQRGVADAGELENLDRQVRHHLADPGTMAVPCLYFLAWGRKPNSQEDTPGGPPSGRGRCDG
jgi:hypothetical protein